MDVILRCMQCNELFRPSSYDSQPIYHFDEKSGSVREVEMNDLDNFMTQHQGHEISRLRIVDGSLCSHYSYWEPVREDYLQATDGIQVYTVKRWRNNVNMPLKYEIVDARIKLDEPAFQAQTVDLKRQMIADAETLGLSEYKINEFAKKFEDLVSQVELCDVIELGSSLDDPMVSYAALEDSVIEGFLKRCSQVFDNEEIQRLRVFIHRNLEYGDVMNILVMHPFRLLSQGGGCCSDPAFAEV